MERAQRGASFQSLGTDAVFIPSSRLLWQRQMTEVHQGVASTARLHARRMALDVQRQVRLQRRPRLFGGVQGRRQRRGLAMRRDAVGLRRGKRALHRLQRLLAGGLLRLDRRQ